MPALPRRRTRASWLFLTQPARRAVPVRSVPLGGGHLGFERDDAHRGGAAGVPRRRGGVGPSAAAAPRRGRARSAPSTRPAATARRAAARRSRAARGRRSPACRSPASASSSTSRSPSLLCLALPGPRTSATRRPRSSWPRSPSGSSSTSGCSRVQAFAIHAFCRLCIATYVLSAGAPRRALAGRGARRGAGAPRRASRGPAPGRGVGARRLCLAGRRRCGRRDAGHRAPRAAGDAPRRTGRGARGPPGGVAGADSRSRRAAAPTSPATAPARRPRGARRTRSTGRSARRSSRRRSTTRRSSSRTSPRRRSESSTRPPSSLDLARRRSRAPRPRRSKVVEFSDFLCPFCRNLAGRSSQFVPQAGGRVAVYFKNYPLDADLQPEAQAARPTRAPATSRSVRCARSYQGKFEAYHDRVFSTELPARRPPTSCASRARRASTRRRSQGCLDDPKTKAELAAQIAEANRVGVSATPTLYINGKKLPRINDFVAVVDKEARKKGFPPLPRPSSSARWSTSSLMAAIATCAPGAIASFFDCALRCTFAYRVAGESRSHGKPAHSIRWAEEARKGRRRLYPMTVVYVLLTTAALACGRALRRVRDGRVRGCSGSRSGPGSSTWCTAYILHGGLPRRPRPEALLARALRPPARRAPQAALGREPHQRHDQGHRPVRGPAGARRGLPAAAHRVLASSRASLQAYVVEEWVHHSVHFYHFDEPLLPVHQAAPPVPPQPRGRQIGLRPDERRCGTPRTGRGSPAGRARLALRPAAPAPGASRLSRRRAERRSNRTRRSVHAVRQGLDPARAPG